MKKGLSYLLIILIGATLFSCKKSDVNTKITKPLVTFVVDKGTATSNGTQIALGPIKDYEQGSDVVYTFTVVSGNPLTKFFVNSTSDVVSSLSKVIKTEPEGAIDASGNFAQGITSVKVYYSYHIDPAVAAGSSVTLSFNFQNSGNYVGTVTHSFITIKIGSTSGRKLQVFDFSWPVRYTMSIGTQDYFNIASGERPEQNYRLQQRQPPFVSFDLGATLGWVPADVLANPDKIDMTGFRARYTSATPSVALNQFYLASPSYIELLGHMYVGCQYLNVNIVGTGGTAQVNAGGLTLPLTYATSTTVTATNFVNANKAAYALRGLTLTSNGTQLIWTVAAIPAAPAGSTAPIAAPAVGQTGTAIGVPYDPVVVTNLTGDLAGNPQPQQSNNFLSELHNRQFRDILISMGAKLKAAGSGLRVVYFKRLDNITGPSQVTLANFNSITYDNEFPTILADVETTGKLYTDALGFSQVWGFSMSDGRKGLIRTSDNSYTDPVTGGISTVDSFTGGNYLLFGVIKVQQKP